MYKTGDNVKFNKGVFRGYTGVVSNNFTYNGITTYIVNIPNPKSIVEHYVATANSNDIELLNKKHE